jgi:hypothetical protein
MIISREEQDYISYDGFDAAIIGTVERIGLNVLCYDLNKVLEILVAQHGMDIDEAYEYYEYNMIGGWLGDNTPVFLSGKE